MLRDIRFAFRVLLQAKGWTAVVILSLALGIGVNATLFSALNGLMLKTVTVEAPEELVRLRWAGENQMATSRWDYGYMAETAAGERVRSTFSRDIFDQLRESNQTLSGILACAPTFRVNVVVEGRAELASSVVVSGGYFEVLGVPAFIGRTILPEDNSEGAPPVAMLSYGYWERRFGRNPGVVGTTISVNNVPVTVVGVTPAKYSGIQRLGDTASDIHLPLVLDPQISNSERLNRPTHWWLQILGRLKPGVSPEQVEGNLDGVFQAAARAGMTDYLAGLSTEDRARSRNQDRTAVPRLDVATASRGVYDVSPNSSRSLSILGVVVVLILLIVCANLGNLLLSRATLRRREISVRLSVGATRWRLIRQLLTESVLLSLLGGGLGLIFAFWARELLPVGQTSPLDWRVFAFTAGVCIGAGLTFGIIPALRTTRVDLASSLKETSGNISRSRTLLGKSLLVAQVAISLVLLIGAGLFLRTLQNLRHVDVGFNTRDILLVTVDAGVGQYDEEKVQNLFERMQDAFKSIPGVGAVSWSMPALLTGRTWSSTIHIEGQESLELDAHMMRVSPEFFETLEIPVLAGRNFTLRDGPDAPRVALINQTASREYFGDENPLGCRFGTSPESSGEVEIIGVIGDTKYSSVREVAPPTIYQAYLQMPENEVTFQLRAGLDVSSLVPQVRETARQIDPNLPLAEIRTQAEEVEDRFSQERVFALAYSIFGGLALLLASIGLFGLMSYSVSRRVNEIGVRMALGAERRRVVRMVLGESMLLVVIGSLIGLISAVAAGRLVASLLYGLAPADPLSIALALLLMCLVAGIAGYLPARRASRLDPLKALRYE